MEIRRSHFVGVVDDDFLLMEAPWRLRQWPLRRLLAMQRWSSLLNHYKSPSLACSFLKTNGDVWGRKGTERKRGRRSLCLSKSQVVKGPGAMRSALNLDPAAPTIP